MTEEKDNNPYVVLTIEQVGNGFIVSAQDIYGIYGDRAMRRADAHVFQSFAELSDFLAKRFTHRTEVLHGDRA